MAEYNQLTTKYQFFDELILDDVVAKYRRVDLERMRMHSFKTEYVLPLRFTHWHDRQTIAAPQQQHVF